MTHNSPMRKFFHRLTGHTADDWETPETPGVILFGWRSGVSRYKCNQCGRLFWRDRFSGRQVNDDDPRLINAT